MTTNEEDLGLYEDNIEKIKDQYIKFKNENPFLNENELMFLMFVRELRQIKVEING